MIQAQNIQIVDPKDVFYGECSGCGYPLPPPSDDSTGGTVGHQCPLTTSTPTNRWIWVPITILALFLSGCGVDRFLGSTTASYEITPTGPKIYYSSNKDQQGFIADVELDSLGKVKKFHVSTTATTPEAAIAAALQSNLKFQEQFGDILKAVIPMIEQAATKGAIAPKIGGPDAKTTSQPGGSTLIPGPIP